MRLYASMVHPISHEVVRVLLASKDIEASAPKEVEADVESVLTSYLSTEKEVDEKTKDLLERTGRGNSEFSRVRQQIAESAGIRVGDEALDYILDQVVEMFHHSQHVEEIYPEDVELRRKMAPVFKRFMGADAQLDTEVRAQMKHVQEGTRTWDIEYARIMEATKRKRGLS